MTDRVRKDAERRLEDEIRRVKKLEAEHSSSNRMAERIQYLLDDGWPAEDIANQIAEEFGV